MKIIRLLFGSFYALIKQKIIMLRYILRVPSLKLEGLCDLRNVQFAKHNYVCNARVHNTEIGNYSYIAAGCNINHCVIGNYTCIGPKVQIGLGEHPTNQFSVHPVFYRDTSNLGYNSNLRGGHFQEYNSVYIGSDVWIGSNVIVKSGVSIGNGSIIAAGSVVSKNVEPFTIVGGIPAKLIRHRFSEGVKTRLLKSNWWDTELEHFNLDEMNSLKKLINNE